MSTKEELMEIARELDIPGRSMMSKEELEEAIAEYAVEEELVSDIAEDDNDADDGEIIPEGFVRIHDRFWKRILLERDNRPSVGEPDLLDTVERRGSGVVMPLATARAFGVHPSLYA